jgi:hypothetical protein
MEFFEGEFPEQPKLVNIADLPIESQIRITSYVIKVLEVHRRYYIEVENYEQCEVIKNTIEVLQKKVIDLQTKDAKND